MKQILTILVAAALLSSCSNGTKSSASTTDSAKVKVDTTTKATLTVTPTTSVTAADTCKH